MKTKLWQSNEIPTLHPQIEAYTVGNDRALDQQLLGYDITATIAHVSMLHTIGIFTKKEHTKLLSCLDQLYITWRDGRFTITDDYEDGHSAIELYVTERLGDIGKKIHTARSRNDQALVMMRLYMKDQLSLTMQKISTLVSAYELKSKEAGLQKMPGYTHTQKAMPSSVRMWLDCYKEAFNDQIGFIDATRQIINQNPLGSAAGFGINTKIDRAMTTKFLKFAKIQNNPMYCGISRGVFELMTVQALCPTMTFIGKFAQDMIQFTSQEYEFFALPSNMTTGSSIMPHKRNYDVFEIMRAQAHNFNGYVTQLQSISSGVGSGYHRDLQLTKGILLEATSEVQSSIDMLSTCVEQLIIKGANLDLAMSDDLESVAKIMELIDNGMSFRDAYSQVKTALLKN